MNKYDSFSKANVYEALRERKKKFKNSINSCLKKKSYDIEEKAKVAG